MALPPQTHPHTPPTVLSLAVVGAGPVGLALALHAARQLPQARITVFDARPLDKDVSADPRTLALSLGSVQLLKRLQAFDERAAQPIAEVHVSQAPPSLLPGLGEPEVRIRAVDEAVPMLGAVLHYGAVVAPLQRAWLEAAAREPQRLVTRFGTAVQALKPVAAGVEVDAGVAEIVDLAVVAEGGVWSPRPPGASNDAAAAAGGAAVPHPGPTGVLSGDAGRQAITSAYGQTAWVGQVALAGGQPGVAFERFTRHGPAALLPLPGRGAEGRLSAALVWCVPTDDDPVRDLTDAQRVAVLNTVFPAAAGRITAISPLKAFPLGLNAERTLVQGRSVRIGNAAQTLHPVAGQGLNLGLRDAHELVQALQRQPDVDAALRRLEWRRAPDRWSTIAATDFLARSFTWKAPGLPTARALGLAVLQALGPARSRLARQMMFGRR